MRKRVLQTVCFLLALAMLFAGCSKKKTSVPTTTTVPAGEAAYTVEVLSEGGKALSNVEVRIYVDNSLSDLQWAGSTDENGLFSFTAPVSDSYCAVLRNVPVGYEYADSYPLTGESTLLELKTKLLTDVDLSTHKVNLGDVMFDFTVTDCDGVQHTLSQLLEQKDAVILNLWFEGCVPCKQEFPHFQAAYEAYSDRIALLALNPVDGNDTSVGAYRTENGLTFPMAKVGAEWQLIFGDIAYPTTVVIDKFGTVSLIYTNSITDAALMDDLFSYYTSETYTQHTVGSLDDLKSQDAAQGTAENPLEFGGVTEFEVTAAAGQTVYCNVYKVSGMLMTITDPSVSVVYNGDTYTPENGEISFVVTAPDTYTPANLAITNTGDAEKTIGVSFSFLPGTMSNPYALEVGGFTVQIAAGNDQGVYYNYIAGETGELTVKLTGATDGVEYGFSLYNLNSYVYRTLEADGQESKLTIAVTAGDTIQFAATTLPDANNEYPAAELKFVASFAVMSTEPTDPTEPQPTESVEATTKPTTPKPTTTKPTETEPTTVPTEPVNKITYTVTVVNEEGNLLSDVSVKLSGDAGTATVSTNASGVATFQLPEGTYTITVTPPSGYDAPSVSYKVTSTFQNEQVMLPLSVPEGYTKLYVGLAKNLSAGTTNVTLTAGEVTYFVFTPTKSGLYRFTASSPISYWGTPSFISNQTAGTDISGNVFTLNIKDSNIGASYVLGVTASGSTSSGSVTITRVSAATTDVTDQPWVEYKGTHTPVDYTFSGGTLKRVDITGSFTLVLGSDGFYHKDTADGPIVYLDFDDSEYMLPLSGILSEGTGIRAYVTQTDGTIIKEDYQDLFSAYVEAADSSKKIYPLTEDLAHILKEYGEDQGWWDVTVNGAIIAAVPNVNTEIAWMFACFYTE